VEISFANKHDKLIDSNSDGDFEMAFLNTDETDLDRLTLISSFIYRLQFPD
jgi:hypothetical protein